MTVAFVDENRDDFGVEVICRTLQVAPSSYYAAKKRQIAPSARAVRDALMMQVLLALWITNRKVYGADKLWKAARRAGHDVGRDQVARLMRQLGIEGVSRLRKKVFTARQDPDATRAPDLVNRKFTADRPDAAGDRPDLCPDPVGDGLHVFHRRRVQLADRRRAGRGEHEDRDGPRRPGDGEVSRGGHRLIGLVTHSDAGSQLTSVRFTERLGEIGARPSIGTVADSYDKALAETTNGVYKTECVYGLDATGWEDVDEFELATLSWVHWFNEDRLHGHCGDVPPAEYEAAFYAAEPAGPAGVGIQ